MENNNKEKIELVKSLINQAIKEKKSLDKVSVEHDLYRSFANSFIRHLKNNKTITKKNKEELIKLYNQYKKQSKTFGSEVTTKEEKEQISEVYYDKSISWDERMVKLCKMFNRTERTMRKWLVNLGFKHKQEEESEQWKEAKKKEFNTKKKRFLVSWCQNNTAINKGLLKNMEVYAKHIDAQIMIIAGRYNNQTQTLDKDTSEFWADEVLPYLTANRHELNNYITVLGDIKVQATQANPLTGLESVSKENSCIVGSPRVHMKTVAVLEGQRPKYMYSTGAISNPNFTDSRIGKTGEFNFTQGFVVVELQDENVFYARQVTTEKNGSFYDLYFKVSNGKVEKINSISALIMGDLHLGLHDEKIIDKTFNTLCKKIKPKHLVLHDLFDGHSCNPHEMHDVFKQHEREMNGTNCLKSEINFMLDWLGKIEKDYNIVVIKSNHDIFLDRFLQNDWRKLSTLKNSIPYMKYAEALLSGKAPNGAIPYIINEKYPKIKCLTFTESFKVHEWELSQHFHLGINGSRGGGVNMFKKLSSKMVGAHGHQESRADGAVMVGTNTILRHGYNQSPSSWTQGSAIIHADGKLQQISFMKTGKGDELNFTTFK